MGETNQERRQRLGISDEDYRESYGDIPNNATAVGSGLSTEYDPSTGTTREQRTLEGRYYTPEEWAARGGGAGGGGGAGWGSGDGYSLPGVPRPNLPQYVKPPAFAYDDYASGAPFSYADWQAPSPDQVLQDPSYLWRKGQGEDSLQRWAAAKGTLNDSGTATALMDYGQGAASQEYGNVYGREFDIYRTNRAGALDTYNVNEGNRFRDYMANRTGALSQYNTNYQTQYTDPYAFDYQRETDLFAPQMAEWEAGVDFRNLRYGTDAAERMQGTQLGTTDAWNRYLADQQEKRWRDDFQWRVQSED